MRKRLRKQQRQRPTIINLWPDVAELRRNVEMLHDLRGQGNELAVAFRDQGEQLLDISRASTPKQRYNWNIRNVPLFITGELSRSTRKCTNKEELSCSLNCRQALTCPQYHPDYLKPVHEKKIESYFRDYRAILHKNSTLANQRFCFAVNWCY